MISLKRNNKGKQVPALGIRITQTTVYSPRQTDDFKISRSKFSDFLSCKKCFYLDRVKGLVSPSTPGWTLNETTDILLKKEFDLCRQSGTPHRTFESSGLNNVVPFQHADIDKWRDSLRHGLQYKLPGTNIILHGGIDDVWIDQNTERLIVVDYKSQASRQPVEPESYLEAVYHQSYKVQLDVYAYLLERLGFEVSRTGYFYVCNGNRDADAFSGRIEFEETLIPYDWDSSWIDQKLSEMINTMNDPEIPESNPSCENCAYANQRLLLGV